MGWILQAPMILGAKDGVGFACCHEQETVGSSDYYISRTEPPLSASRIGRQAQRSRHSTKICSVEYAHRVSTLKFFLLHHRQ